MQKWYASRKFWLGVASSVAALLVTVLDVLPPESKIYGVLAMASSVAAYIIAQGKVDAVSAGNPPKAP